MSKQTVCAIICAAGKGSRTGFSKNKLLIPFQGETALQKAISAFCFPAINEIIVTASKEDFDEITTLCKGFDKAKVVVGGEDRSHSVYNALRETNADIVLIHDGARPFITRRVIENCIASVQTNGSGICAVACKDTIATVKNGKIVNVPNRNDLRQIQTPQGFFRENILSAYEQAFDLNDGVYTDDSSVFARFCGTPYLCDGDSVNIKLTYAEDFIDNAARCGFGIDTHAFGKPQDFILLGGVKIPSHSGLIAHSDGDVLVHAVMDALLSAAGLKDIGHYFPDSDAQWKNANSMDLLAQVVTLVGEQGYAVKNLSVAIQAEKPRLANYIDDIKISLSTVLGVDETAIGVSAGTNEGLGYVGEGKGITVNAYALLRSK